MSLQHLKNGNDRGKFNIRTTTCPCTTLSVTNPTNIGLGSTADIRNDRAATNRCTMTRTPNYLIRCIISIQKHSGLKLAARLLVMPRSEFKELCFHAFYKFRNWSTKIQGHFFFILLLCVCMCVCVCVCVCVCSFSIKLYCQPLILLSVCGTWIKYEHEALVKRYWQGEPK